VIMGWIRLLFIRWAIFEEKAEFGNADHWALLISKKKSVLGQLNSLNEQHQAPDTPNDTQRKNQPFARNRDFVVTI
jgi:hypothetical protein